MTVKQPTGQMRRLPTPKWKWWTKQSVVAFLSEKLRKRNQIEVVTSELFL